MAAQRRLRSITYANRHFVGLFPHPLRKCDLFPTITAEEDPAPAVKVSVHAYGLLAKRRMDNTPDKRGTCKRRWWTYHSIIRMSRAASAIQGQNSRCPISSRRVLAV